MVWLLKSKGIRNCKSTESFCLSILTIFKWLTHFLTCLQWPHLLNMYKPRTSFFLLWRAGPPGLAFYESGIVCLSRWLGMVNAGWLSSIQSEIFLQIKFIIFQGCPMKWAAFFLGSMLHKISSLFSHFRLFQNEVLHKVLRLGFWDFQFIFLRMQFSLVATFIL